MVSINIRGRGSLSQNDYHQRMRSMAHLVGASKDINYWVFSIQPSPEWAPLSADHVFQAKCKKSDVLTWWLIDKTQADENGSFEREHNRIREHFTGNLLEFDHIYKKALARIKIGQSGLVLPDTEPNFDMMAREAIWRGDHDNSYQ